MAQHVLAGHDLDAGATVRLAQRDLVLVEAVRRAGSPGGRVDAAYGLGGDDNPVFAHMHEAGRHVVGASLEVMDRDSRRMRGERPFVFTNIRAEQGVTAVTGAPAPLPAPSAAASRTPNPR